MTALFPDTSRSAVFSECGTYRFTLTRKTGIDSPRKLGYLGQNPSKAGADRDDPTSRKWMYFARQWGFGAYIAINAFALISTDPRLLPKLDREGVNVVGLDNRRWQEEVAREVDMLVITCGTPAWKRGIELAWTTIEHLSTIRELHALRVSGGLPHHSLYLPNDTTPFSWKAP